MKLKENWLYVNVTPINQIDLDDAEFYFRGFDKAKDDIVYDVVH